MNRPTLTKKIYHALTRHCSEDTSSDKQLLIAARLTRILLPAERQINKCDHEEVNLPFEQKPLYVQISNGTDWAGICRGREYFGDDISDPVDGITQDIKTHLDLQKFGLFLNQITV